MSWKVELEGFAEFKADLIKAQTELMAQGEIAMWDAVHLLESEAKAIVPKKSGRLAGSILSEVRPYGTGIQGEVGTNVGYARPIEFGQKAHYIAGREISPQTGKTKLLKFDVGGHTWFKAYVYHPGSKAYEFLGGALDNTKDLIIDRFVKVRDHVMDVLKD